MILFDSFTNNKTLLDSRRQLVVEFLNFYKDGQENQFGFALNTDLSNGSQVALSTSKTNVLYAMDKVTGSSGNLSLTE